jgi:endonuclease YncB( thermonuclease family)
MTAPVHDWVFRARPVDVLDGDTLTLELDLGLNVRRVETVRLLDAAAPELRGASRPRGLLARAWLAEWLEHAAEDAASAWPLVLRSHQPPRPGDPNPREKYGRLLAEIWRTVDGEHLNAAIVAAGHARPWDGRGAQPA